MGNFLAGDPKVVMGIERYGHRMFPEGFSLEPDLFRKERFMRIIEGDTFYSDFGFTKTAYQNVEEKFDGALWVGDKLPKLYETLDNLFQAFPEDTRVILLFRNIFDVCLSYNMRLNDKNDNWQDGTSAAIKHWNRSIGVYKNSAYKHRIIPIIYEKFFNNETSYLKLCSILGLSTGGDTAQRLQRYVLRSRQLETQRERTLSERDVFEITMNSSFGAFREIVHEYDQLFSDGNPDR